MASMQPYFTDSFYNPSATYLAARSAKSSLDEARATVARTIGAKPGEIIFMAGATEANNLAIRGVAERFHDGEILVSAIEHESVLEPAEAQGAKLIPVDNFGLVKLANIEKLISIKTVLVSVMMVNNEIGSIQPIREVAKIISRIRQNRLAKKNLLPIYLHVDAVQAANWLDLHVSRLGIDLMTLSGAKIYGPKQTGALYIKAGVQLEPLLRGGGQELGLRSGTENVAGAIGFAKALEIAQAKRQAEGKRVMELRNELTSKLEDLGAVVNGSPKHSAPHIVSATFPGIDNETLMMQLDEAGIQVAVGSACSASSDEPSHVLKAIGLSDADARSTLRFSFGHGTTKDEIDHVVKAIKEIVNG